MRRILSLIGLVALLAPSASAATANVSSIAVAGSTVTVTVAVAHGLAANAGVCLTHTPVCTAVATVPTGTTFTFSQPSNVTVAACASSCGTVSTAPRIVILDVAQPNQAQQTVHYLLWLTTTKPIPRSGAASAWVAGAGSAGASSEQNAAISAGNFLEVNLYQTFPSSMTNAQIQTFLQNDYTTRQAALAANTQPGTYYGSVWDGLSWGVQ